MIIERTFTKTTEDYKIILGFIQKYKPLGLYNVYNEENK